MRQIDAVVELSDAEMEAFGRDIALEMGIKAVTREITNNITPADVKIQFEYDSVRRVTVVRGRLCIEEV
jgi:hypothetical protein